MPIVVLAAHVAAGLVLVAGVGKLLRPDATRDAFGGRDTRTVRLAVRALGAAEVGLALAVLTTGGRTAFGLLALTYLGFTAVVLRQRARDRGCGCFGASTTTVGALHVVVDLAAASTAAAAAWLAAPGLPGLLPEGALAAMTTLGLVALAVALGQLVLTALAEVLAAGGPILAGGER